MLAACHVSFQERLDIAIRQVEASREVAGRPVQVAVSWYVSGQRITSYQCHTLAIAQHQLMATCHFYLEEFHDEKEPYVEEPLHVTHMCSWLFEVVFRT